MDIGEYQRLAAETDILDPDDLGLPLLGLTGEVGNLAAEYKKRRRDSVGYRAFSDEVREELGDLLWYAAALARRCHLDLEQVLSDNLRKTQERFLRPDTPPPQPLFDEGLSPAEQLPRNLSITFVEEIDCERGNAPVPVVPYTAGLMQSVILSTTIVMTAMTIASMMRFTLGTWQSWDGHQPCAHC